MTEIYFNKKACFDYEILEHFEAGIILTGQEVKSVKTGHISLKSSFVIRSGKNIVLINANIPPYKFATGINNYDPARPRKLLLKKSEIKNLIGKINASGLTIVPLRVYTKKRLVKIEIALAKGKKRFDKRESIKKRDEDRKIKRALENS